MDGPLKNRNYTWRYLGIVVLFCIVCMMYLGRLFYIQIAGRGDSYDSSVNERRVKIQAVRGEIYDRNGVKLVANNYRYDLLLNYTQFSSMTARQKNEACLAALDAIQKCNAEQTRPMQRFFPFEGSAYPYYYYSAEAEDGFSLRFYRLRRVLDDIGLSENTTAEQLRDYYVKRYELLAVDNSGERLYNDNEIDSLIRLYYDLDAVRFRNSGEYTLAEGADMTLMTHLKELRLSAVDCRVNVTRTYCHPGYASHILGTIGPIYSEEWDYYNEQGYQMNEMVGKTGCELAFEKYLRGTDGTLLIKEDEHGNVIDMTVIEEPVAGNDVRLTIDIALQIAAEDGLRDNVAYVADKATSPQTGSGCNAGAAVALDPDTFEVLAIASYPSYDLGSYNEIYNDLAGDVALPLLNRALNGSYAPGSTYKLGMAAIGLMEEAILPSTYIDCEGRYPYRGANGGVGCSTYGDNHWSSLEVVHAIAYSCNSFFCEVGDRLGIETMEKYMKKFGIGQSTGFELGGTSGILAGPSYRAQIQGEAWMPGMTWQSAIGQSDNQVSPLQLACYMGTLANGGTRYTAHLLHSVYKIGEETPVLEWQQTEDTVLDRMDIPQETLRTVFEGMREVVRSSEVIQRWINSSIPVTVGGKTGTAQNSTDCDNALFVCGAPYDDPEIVIASVIEKGYTGGYASFTAGRILEAYYNSDDVKG